MRVVIPADDPPLVARSSHLDRLREVCEVSLWTDRPVDNRQKLERLRDADILLNSRGHVSFNRDLLQQLPRLKMIAVCGIGYDAIDLSAATANGVVVSNIPGRTAAVVAEHAFALMLSVARRTALMTQEIRAGRWPGELGTSLRGRTIGVVGTGTIGTEMIRLCAAFGMRVIAWTFHPDPQKASSLGIEYVSLEELLQQSDVVSLHVRLTQDSRHMIGARQLQMMKRSAILINTARGPVVDTMALVDVLRADNIFGAGIDVYDVEPIEAEHPLLTCGNVVLTPHSADQTQEGIDLLTEGCVDNISAFLAGRPQNVVNPAVLDKL
jgi:phosphoglycerate dehydrogenase-like enzyme